MLTEKACADLARDRLAVIDGAFPEHCMAAMQEELKALSQCDYMKPHPHDLCNPGALRFYLMLTGPEARKHEKVCPTTASVLRRLLAVPNVLEEELGMRLAVPRTAMLSCHPPGAKYQRHLDSYRLHQGSERVPRKVTILLYCNVGWTPATGCKLRTWAPFDDGKGPSRDFEPKAGRLIMFMSEEIWHEVLPANADRYAFTLWVFDRDHATMAS
eukprot:NODE_2654_length_897_cov_324.009501.p1 GENE.NODE_2654_length_897_cov_324.009501~~NODE_2654_length_897_cov_324.009501.p1  ORF type:complete len:249 (-),score=72.94 NODE_2654_length_897_cov_324.009501:133-774(-)